jgi:anti-sigma B factor antagonist
MLTITHQEQNGKQVFGIDGRVDADGATQMEQTITKVLNAGKYQLVLDLSQTNYLNSAGLRVMADVLTQCQDKGGDVKIAAPNLKITRVFEIIGFDKFFHVYETIEAALSAD